MISKMMTCVLVLCSTTFVVLGAEVAEESILSVESLLIENMSIFVAASPDSGSAAERNIQQQGFDEMREQLFAIADGNPQHVAKGIVRFLVSRDFRANVHPMVAGALVMDPKEVWEISMKDILKAFIELSPYPDDYTRDWAIGLFLYPHSLARPSDAPRSAIIPDLLEWLDEYGLNNSSESVFLVSSVFEAASYRKLDALDALLEYTSTTDEVLEEWRVSTVEELEQPTSPDLLNRYLCSKNLWARLFGLSIARNRSTSMDLLEDEPCLNQGAEHPLEARWAAELKAKLEAEAEKENADADAGTAEAD